METYTYGDTILKVTGVSLAFGEKKILSDINLEIKDVIRPGKTTGQIIGFLGPSGRGKTQLFKILAGLNKRHEGTVSINGGAEVKAGDVGVVAQKYPLFENMTVWDNLELVANKNFTKKEKEDKINFYLERFKMTEHKDKYPAVLSGGQRQRIAILQQMLCSEYFILLDEPFSGLDPNMTTEVCQMIQEVADLDDKNTIIVISHDIYSMVSIANELWMLGFDYEEKDGVKVPDGKGARIKFVENLMDKGFCWRKDFVDSPEYFNYVKDIRKVFNDL